MPLLRATELTPFGMRNEPGTAAVRSPPESPRGDADRNVGKAMHGAWSADTRYEGR